MTLNPGLRPILDAMAAMPALDFETVPVAEMRALFDAPMAQGEPIPMARAEALDIALEGRTLAARLYVPQGAAARPPAVVYFHGGGWMIGTLETHDATCRALARASGAAVVSVAYRLAPEHPYPAAAEDAFEALRWVAGHAGGLGLDGQRLAVAGDSAGGNLAAAAAIMARAAGGPALRHQLLVYPVTDADFETASYRANGGGEYFLSTAAMRRFWRDYLGGAEPADAPLAAVLRQPALSGLPPATVLVAQYDPLRDEGLGYARRLAEAGVATETIEAGGMIHGFFSMFEQIPDAGPYIEQAGARLAQALA